MGSYYLDKEYDDDAEAEQDRSADLTTGDATSSAVRSSAELLKEAEAAAQPTADLDARSLRKLTGSFSKKCRENLEQRMKHPDDPEKFMESEVDLDEAVQDLFQLVNAPELYPTFVETQVCSDLLQLLTHENRDIAADVVQLFASLTDTADNEEWLRSFRGLAEHLSELNATELLIQHLEKCSEQTDEEAAVVFNLLTALDNLMDVLPAVAKQTGSNRRFVKWLLYRLSQAEFDSVKQICGEMLVEILQQDVGGAVVEMGGLDVLLRCIQQSTAHEAGSDDEIELVGNLFDGLCCALLLPSAKNAFLKSGGMDMCLDVARKRKDLRLNCLKVLEFATTGSAAACRRVLTASGLKTVFSVFMKKLALSGKRDPEAEQKGEELVITVIANLLEGLESESGYERVAAKFVENEFEKCDRLLEAYDIYRARVVAAEDEMQEEEAEAKTETKLDAGLATLQHICWIVCHLWRTEDRALRKRLLLLLHQKGQTLGNVVGVVEEMIEMMDSEEQREQFRTRLPSLEKREPQSESVRDARAEEALLTKEALKERIAAKRKSKRQKTEG